MSISVAPSDKNKGSKGNNKSELPAVADSSFVIKYNENEAKEVIGYILKQYNDYTDQAQYELFLSLSKIDLNMSEFRTLKKEVKKNIKAKFAEQTALMEYHVDHVMSREHTNIINFLVKKLAYYKDLWEKAAYVKSPNLDRLEQLDRMIHSTARILSEFNLGTNVILFIQKKFEMLESKNNALNIKEITNLDIYNNNDNIVDITPNASPELTTPTTEDFRGEDERTAPSVKLDARKHAQRSDIESVTQRLGGTQEAFSDRAREAVF